ncbi:MAG: hypothetical protein AAF585_15630 [Verrucomicrobiota bacterium]
MAKKRIAVKKKARAPKKEKKAPVKEHRAPAKVIELVTPHGQGVPDEIVDELNLTRTWVNIASLIFFLGALISLVFLVTTLVGIKGAGDGDGMSTPQLIMAVVALIWLITMILTMTVGIRMNAFATRIDRLSKSKTEEDLEIVLGNLKGFWAMLGGVAITFLATGVIQVLIQRAL